MESIRKIGPGGAVPQNRSIFEGLLRGYRFSVCETPDAVARGIDVRRRVYRDACHIDVPVPDEYDGRSWFLLAERDEDGAPVGSMRVTPRSLGSLEAEEYFDLPAQAMAPGVVEVTRFAILPEHRQSRRFLPVVALGLYKLVCHFTRQLRASYVVICAKPERSFSFQWLGFTPTGLKAHYAKLANAEHELLTCDVRGDMVQHQVHRYWQFVFEIEHREVVLPSRIPPCGLGFARPAWGERVWGTA